MEKFNFDGYASLLKKWVVFSQKHLYRCPEDRELICYGNGTGTNWGMQTHLKAMSAFATVAKLDRIDLSGEPITKEELLAQSLSMLRYAIRTHLVGDFCCTDGERWGHSWIFALGIERMFHAVELLWDDLTDEDKAGLRRLLISECDFLLFDYEIVAGLVENNKPESNIWNGALLYRTAALYPDAANREGYIEKAYRFFANGISVESDENSDEIVGGRHIGDVFVGADMFDSFSCNHHRYLNIGYMNICLSNIAMLHFFLKSRGEAADPIIYHNLYKQWRLIRSTTFDDGRLIRIGSDTRARYCYCQDYALVGWRLIEDVYGEDCTELENGWLSQLEAECLANGDGSFLSERFGYFEHTSPLYYTRLESDRANAISLALYWHDKYECDLHPSPENIDAWSDEYHGSAFVSSPRRFASFTWRAALGPTGLLLPGGDSAMAEWRGNFSARVWGVGNKNEDDHESAKALLFDGGFLNYGSSVAYCDEFGEGQQKERMARKHMAYAALPDGKSVLMLQYVTALNRVFVKESGGIFWNIPNDIYNGGVRRLASELFSGEVKLSFERGEERIPLGNYLVADGKIGIASTEPMTLIRRKRRQIDIKGRPESGTLYCEEVTSSFRDGGFWVDRGEVLVDTGFCVSLGGEPEIKKMNESLIRISEGGIKGVLVISDGVRYLLLMNVSDKDETVKLSAYGIEEARELSLGEATSELALSPGEAKLVKVLK